MEMARNIAEDILVDKMIAASHRKGELALPSYGRNFVPYFVPGASNPSEHDINLNTDVDTFRRAGASFLDAPLPTTMGQGLAGAVDAHSTSTSRRKAGRRRNLAAGPATKGKGHRSGHLEAAAPTKATVSQAPVPPGLATVAEVPTSSPGRAPLPFSSASSSPGCTTMPVVPLGERFAGPICTSSPPPSSLPFPGFCKGSLPTPIRRLQLEDLRITNFAFSQQLVA